MYLDNYDRHMKGVHMDALSYADDIRILSPSIVGLKEMLKIWHMFAEKNKIALYLTVKIQCVLNLEAILLEMKKHI